MCWQITVHWANQRLRIHTIILTLTNLSLSICTTCSILLIHVIVNDNLGSERVKKSGAAGQRLREAVGINYSLLVLGRYIIRAIIPV